ncbi:rubredoxin [Sphingobium sp. AN641]|uniref:rubredoxin n=1 Tax=Sphingobium sp. AN641 TaxID=3133443 RepID=UPI0030BABF45
MRQWQCNYCSHVYDEALGDPDSDIPPGTRWEDVPDDWYCPDCGQPKASFTLIEN